MDIRFDAARLASEAQQFDAREWRDGALPLVCAYGDPANAEPKGPMRPTPHLKRCPHVTEVLESLASVIGRTRFVREVAPDVSYYALRHETIALPFDGGHLLIDTTAARTHGFENLNLPIVMSPFEQESLLAHLPRSEGLEQFLSDWRALWSIHGDRPSGWSAFASLRDALLQDVHDPRVHELLIRPALNPDLASQRDAPAQRRIERPVFVVAPSGAGAVLLASLLARSPGVFLAERVDIAGELTPAAAYELEERVYRDLRDRNGNPPSGTVRAVAATRETRVRALRSVFPDALFIFLYRNAKAAIATTRSSSAVEAAKSWATSSNALLDELEALPPERWCITSFERLGDDLDRLREFVGFARGDAAFDPPPPPSPLSDADRAAVEPIVQAAESRARELFARPPARRNRVTRDDAASFRSVHTTNFAEILHALGASLIVTTYQSGRVVLLRAEDPGTLNTHLRMYSNPMGVAVAPNALALGTRTEVWDFRNHPDVAAKLEPRRHDACYLPRNVHLTGDIRIHELAFAGDELWAVNTRFSTLCTFNHDYSFLPRWRPPFITALAAEDRCHLNGMSIRDGQVSHVTALGENDTDNGWRENKARGGIVIDVDSNELVLRGLSMPHSPRWYGGQFFVLESGKGTLATADLATGRIETIIELPGFTRGLAFAGAFAFVGLSQVRESNIFGGIPLVERVAERQCGVWVIDLRTGQTVAFLRFEGAVQEIFDVQVLRGIRYPDLLEPGDPHVAATYVVPG